MTFEPGVAVDELLLDAYEQEDPVQQVSLGRSDAIKGMRESLDFLAANILTSIYAYGYPPILKAMWQLICTSALKTVGKDRFALGIPRGFSKTILLKLYVCWCILFTDRKFILVICVIEGRAQDFLADVAMMLDSLNIITLFGNWRVKMTKDTQGLYKFSFRGRDIILAGLGAGGSPRGLNINFVRPDLVIMDDIQKKEEAGNQELADALMVWMLGTLMKACDPHVCTYIFVGNMYPYEGCLLRKLKESKEWISIITGAITADGCSIWPEHRDIPDLLEELRVDTEQGHPEIFFSEVMNDEEAGTVSGIDVSRIPMCPSYLDTGSAQGGFVIIDPSGSKKKSDDTAVGAVLIFDGIPVLRSIKTGKLDPSKTVQEAVFLAMEHQMQLIVSEDVAYQSTLAFWARQVFEQVQLEGVTWELVSPEGMQKNARIRDMLKMLLSGKILLHKEVRNLVIYQITQWNPLKSNNKDDILDILAYIMSVMAKFPHLLPLMIMEEYKEDLPQAEFAQSLALPF